MERWSIQLASAGVILTSIKPFLPYLRVSLVLVDTKIFMKRLFPILFLLLNITCSAQYFSEYARWHFDYEKNVFENASGNLRMEVVSETTKDSTTTVTFKKNYHIQYWEEQDPRVFSQNLTLSIKDSVIYYADSLVWFDLKLKSKDTIAFYRWPSEPIDSFYPFEVDSLYTDEEGQRNWLLRLAKDSVVVMEKNRRARMSLHFMEGVGFVGFESEIEDIGTNSLVSFIPFYYWSHALDHVDPESFTCYKNWGTSFLYPPNGKCGSLSTEEPSISNEWSVYCENNKVTVSFPSMQTSYKQLQVFDTQGKLQYSVNLSGEIKMHSFQKPKKPGIYFYHLRDHNLDLGQKVIFHE